MPSSKYNMLICISRPGRGVTVDPYYLPTTYVASGQCLPYDGGFYGTTCNIFCDPWQFLSLGIGTSQLPGATLSYIHAACNSSGMLTCLRMILPYCQPRKLNWKLLKIIVLNSLFF